MTPSSLGGLSKRHKMPQLQIPKGRVPERRVRRVDALSRPGRPGPAKEQDFLEMILHIQADTEKLDVAGAHIP